MGDMQIVVAGCDKVEPQYVEMMVPLYSYGCDKKIKKALASLKGIYSVDVNYYQQKVTVWGICNKDQVLATVKTKRKEARFWDLDKDGLNNDTKNYNAVEKDHQPKRSLSLVRASSFSWKTVRKVFSRAYSF